MVKNWLLTALRNLRKNKTAAAINIFGLTVGLSSCLLIALFIRHELSYDDFETRGNRIARVIMQYRFDGGGEMRSGNFTSTKVAPTFKRTFPEVESAVRMRMDEYIVRSGDKLLNEKRFMFADSSFFDLFSFGLLRGDVHTALSGPRRVILTETTARRYFGGQDPMGRMIHVGNDTTGYLITGVMKDVPDNSQFKFDFLASFSSLFANQEETYWDASYGTFLLLRRPEDLALLQPKVTAFMKSEMQGKGATINFLLEPFMRIHLYSPYIGWEPTTPIVYIYILSIVALLILVIACSTYINLSTARSVDRAREVGVRKVIGAGRGQLFWQFIGESFLLSLIAVVLSLLVVVLVLPSFNRLADRGLPLSGVFSGAFGFFALGIAVVVSLLAGSYPALVLSRFHPVTVLKGAFRNTRSGRGLRQSLIVFQFAISVFLIVSTIILQQQLRYIRNRDLGYDRDHVIELPMDPSLLAHIDYIKAQFRMDPDVLSVSYARSSPVSIVSGFNMRSAAMPSNQQVAVYGDAIEPDFLPTTGLQLVAGENITRQDMRDAYPDQYDGNGVWLPEGKRGAAAGSRPAGGAGSGSGGSAGSAGGSHGSGSGDSAGSAGVAAPAPFFHFLLNEAAARDLGWTPQQAIGKRMFMDDSRPGIVKGVVKDFNFSSLHEPIKGLVLFPDMRAFSLLVRVSGQHLPQTLAFLESKWASLEPSIPYQAHFLDENYNRIYTAENRLGTVMNLFSAIAIVLACLGLFGLSSYAAKQRVKEIGIRKVLGARLGHLAFLLSASFLRLAALALVIAFPLAWLAMDRWLGDFAYGTSIHGWVFLVAGSAVLVITLVTVSVQAVRTALLNPVKNLRSE